MRRTHGVKMAALAGASGTFVSELLSGRKNASAPIADRLAAITNTDIRIWLRGGDPAARRAAADAWSERVARKAGK